MRIGLFTDCYYPQINGVVVSVIMLKEELEKLGHDVTVITVAVPKYSIHEPGVIRIKSLPFLKCRDFRIAIPFVFSLYKRIKKLNLDIIHTHTEFTVGLLGRFAALRLGIPLIHTYHTMYKDYTHYISSFKSVQNRMKGIIGKLSVKYTKPASAVITPTIKSKKLLKDYNIETPIYILPTGVDVDRFSSPDKRQCEKIRSKYDPDGKSFIILSLGRLSKEKSVEHIIGQMPAIVGKSPFAKLIVVGDGPYRENLEDYAKTLSLPDNIFFTGRVPFCDVANYYAVSDMFISASRTESQGLAITEAMASRIPVAVYDDDNVSGVVIHNRSGLLFDNPSDIPQCVEYIMKNKKKASEMAKEGYRIVKNISKEACNHKLLEIYRKVYSGKNSSEKVAKIHDADIL